VLLDPIEIPRWLHEQLVARIKVMARLDISERRRPQDGHIADTQEGVEGRLSTMPTDRGEAVVVRLFRDRGNPPSIVGLGCGLEVAAQLRAISRRLQGILIVAGPTGSGKTTTLYAIIDEIRASPLNIVTIEDPIEYRVDGLRQIQVDEKAKLTFHRVLRSVLRQDPDVILVGEIRDSETARIAFEAALTGHLVLSTVHATDATSILLRLSDLGIDSYVVRSAVIGAVAQRLVRKNCPHCLQLDRPLPFYSERFRISKSEGARLRRSYGCSDCRFTGIGERIPLFEILEVNAMTREYVVAGKERQLRRVASEVGFVPVIDQARDMVVKGELAIEEAYRTCYFGDVV
jgi:type II secretory ATPase GspE/PulE/Tfp pilus assembly ATPase PilB-like protein